MKNVMIYYVYYARQQSYVAYFFIKVITRQDDEISVRKAAEMGCLPQDPGGLPSQNILRRSRWASYYVHWWKI